MSEHDAASPYLTKKLKPSYTAKTLEASDPGRQVLNLRQLLKTKSTFLAPMLGKERIHPELKQMSDGEYGVKFGRFSCVGQTCRHFRNATSALHRSSDPSSFQTKGWLCMRLTSRSRNPASMHISLNARVSLTVTIPSRPSTSIV
jgi:hypothetical protein